MTEPDPDPTPPRMSADEAREVIDLWLTRRDPSALSDSPSVPDVAEGLDITPQQTQLLLAEVRARRAAQDAQTRQETEQANLQMLAAELMRRQDENTERILETVRAEARRERYSGRYRERVLLTPNSYPEVRAFGWKGFTNEAKSDEAASANTSPPLPLVRLPRPVESLFQTVSDWQKRNPTATAFFTIAAIGLFLIIVVLCNHW